MGPGIPPVSPKLVAAIVSGEFIDFALLLEDHVDPLRFRVTAGGPRRAVGETIIKRVSYAKTLGVVIDDHLTWERQIDNIQTKISKGISVLRRMKKIVPITALT